MLNNYFTEIISKQDWRKKSNKFGFIYDKDNDKKYRNIVTNFIDFKEYKENLKHLKALFKKMNKGKFKSTLIFDYESIKIDNYELMNKDLEIIKILSSLGYEISNESYMLGFALKDKKPIMIADIITTLKAKNIDKMKEVYEKTKNQNIIKQIDAINKLKNINIKNTIVYKIAKEKGYKIVMSIQPRLIASQSTNVGWTSCMNLDKGERIEFVGAGISHGVIIAYLVKKGDENNLNHPIGRVLIKPLKNENNDIIYIVDKIYGSAPSEFKLKVEKILSDNNVFALQKDQSNLKEGVYRFDSKKLYSDEIFQKLPYYGKIIIRSEEAKKKINNALKEFKNSSNKDEFFKKVDDEIKREVIENRMYVPTSIEPLLSFNKLTEEDIINYLRELTFNNNLFKSIIDYIKNYKILNKKIILYYFNNCFHIPIKDNLTIIKELVKRKFDFDNEIIDSTLSVFYKNPEFEIYYNLFKEIIPVDILVNYLYNLFDDDFDIKETIFNNIPSKFFYRTLYKYLLMRNKEGTFDKVLIEILINSPKMTEYIAKRIANNVLNKKNNSLFYYYVKDWVKNKKFIPKFKKLIGNKLFNEIKKIF